MEDEMRGFIESTLDDLLETDFVESIEWIKQKIPISSFLEFALGYVIGALEGVTFSFVGIKLAMKGQKKAKKEVVSSVEKIIKRRLPEIMEKINKELNR